MGIGSIANSGMNASMQEMEVISNNIANAATPGFKKSYINFADVYPANSGASQPGLGVAVTNILQTFTTGNRQDSGIKTDLIIGKDGFFTVKDPGTGQISYTRAGRFYTDNEGYLTSINGDQRLQGFPSINNSIVASGNVVDLQIPSGPIPAKASTSVTLSGLNLKNGDTIPAGAFNNADPTTYNYRTNSTFYDSLGNTYTLQLYYINTSTANTWTVQAEVTQGSTTSSLGSGSISFNTDGSYDTSSGLSSLVVTPAAGADPLSISAIFNASTTKQFPTDYAVPVSKTDGYQAGTLTGYTIDKDGVITLNYSNQQPVLAGQIAIAKFQSPEYLQNVGNSSWIATPDSGDASMNQKNSSGNIATGAYEGSNVDLSQEMINLISAQHNFQANAQVENVYNEVMKTVIQL